MQGQPDPMMDQGMTPEAPMMPPGAPMAQESMPGGIMGGMGAEPLQLEEPMGEMGGIMGDTMMMDEPSAIDALEDVAMQLAADMGDNVTITRKTKTTKAKRGK